MFGNEYKNSVRTIVFQMQNAPIENGILEIQYDRTFNADFSFLNESEYFGMLQLKMKKCKVSSAPLLFAFTIDKSGSMSNEDYENSRKTTKMDYVKDTFMNLVRYFVNTDARIFIAVNTFNNDVESIIRPVELNPSVMDAVIDKINGIDADGSTDIGRAISYTTQMIGEYKEKHPEHEVIHVFMSDGDPTAGIRSTSELGNIAKQCCCPNIFIGFGKEHNSHLLRHMSAITTGDYQVVDNFEHTTMIFGQMIHPFLYPVIKHPRLEIKNGWIYDWRIGQWVTGINEHLFSSEESKIYQIKTETPETVQVFVYNGEDEEGSPELFETLALPGLIDMNDMHVFDTTSSPDLRRYMFRQETQHLLYRAAECSLPGKIALCDDNGIRTAFAVDKNAKPIRKKMKNLFRRIREYMKTENLLADIFLITLCDDISIAYNTMNTQNGAMYCSARQNSQGRQQTVSITPKELNPVANQTMEDSIGDSDEEKTDTNISFYMPTGEYSTCFASPSLMETFKSLSSQAPRS
jgi:Mg-chelatase subunit ChlD